MPPGTLPAWSGPCPTCGSRSPERWDNRQDSEGEQPTPPESAYVKSFLGRRAGWLHGTCRSPQSQGSGKSRWPGGPHVPLEFIGDVWSEDTDRGVDLGHSDVVLGTVGRTTDGEQQQE